MIIEFVNPVDAKPLIFVHFEFKDGNIQQVRNTAKHLSDTYKNHEVMIVPNGQPCPNNPLPKIAVFDKANEDLLSAIKKVCGRGKPGSFVPLESNEMKAIVHAQENNEIIYF